MRGQLGRVAMIPKSASIQPGGNGSVLRSYGDVTRRGLCQFLEALQIHRGPPHERPRGHAIGDLALREPRGLVRVIVEPNVDGAIVSSCPDVVGFAVTVRKASDNSMGRHGI